MKNLVLVVSLLTLMASAGAGIETGHSEEALLRMGSGNPTAGQLKSETELCQGCHGETGINAISSYPILAGQYANYIVKQLRNFKSGERSHPVMTGMAENLQEGDMSDIAAFFASAPQNKGEVTQANPVGENLFFKGDLKREIVPCISCHGAAGKGTVSGDDVYPMIGGQHKLYLREQLLNWRSGTRRNGSGGVMNMVTRSMTDAEIEALAGYLSGL